MYIYIYIYIHTHPCPLAGAGRGGLSPCIRCRDLVSEGSFVVGNISGLPDSPVTDVTFENVAARNNHRGIQCRETQTWLVVWNMFIFSIYLE